MNASTSANIDTLETRFLSAQANQNTTARAPEWMVLVFGEIRRSARAAHTMLVTQHPVERFQPATIQLEQVPSTNDLAKTLRTIRARIVESGEPLLDWDELEQEIAERRGER